VRTSLGNQAEHAVRWRRCGQSAANLLRQAGLRREHAQAQTASENQDDSPIDAGGLWLFHHKPGRTDEALVRIRLDAQRIFRATETASEGEALQL